MAVSAEVRGVKPDELRRIFADNVRRLASENGMSLNSVAIAAGVARSAFYRVLDCEEAVTIDRLCKIATALDCDPKSLLTSRPHDDPEPILSRGREERWLDWRWAW